MSCFIMSCFHMYPHLTCRVGWHPLKFPVWFIHRILTTSWRHIVDILTYLFVSPSQLTTSHYALHWSPLLSCSTCWFFEWRKRAMLQKVSVWCTSAVSWRTTFRKANGEISDLILMETWLRATDSGSNIFGLPRDHSDPFSACASWSAQIQLAQINISKRKIRDRVKLYETLYEVVMF